jgi:hypothetical protein
LVERASGDEYDRLAGVAAPASRAGDGRVGAGSDDIDRGSRAGAGYPVLLDAAGDDRRLRKAAAASPLVTVEVPGAARDPRTEPPSVFDGAARPPAERIGALDRGTAWPTTSGDASRTTNALRVRTSMRAELTTFRLT